MEFPSIINVAILGSIGVLVLAVIQYLKAGIPEKLIPVISMLAGIGIAFLYFYKPNETVPWVAVIANGILGAIMADTGYGLLSNSKSPGFTLPSKAQLTEKPKEGGT